MTDIEYLSANPGAGKTKAIGDDAKRNALAGDLVIVAMRSKDAIAEFCTKYLSKTNPFYDVKIVISHEDAEETVSSRIVKTIRSRRKAVSKGLILIITHRALFMLPYKELLTGLRLLVDEIPSPVCDWVFPADGAIPLFDQIEAIDLDDGDFLLLTAKAGKLRKPKKSDQSSSSSVATREVAWNLVSPWFDTMISKADFQKLTASSPDEKVHLFSRLRFDSFSVCRSVLVGGAHFEDSLFCHYGKRQGVEFERRGDLEQKLQFTVPDTGPYTTIHYAHDGHWSASLRDKSVDENTNVLQHTAGHIEKLFGDPEFLWSANKGADRDDLFQKPNAVRLPHVSHGLNCFSHIDKVAYLSATNPTPWMSAFHIANGLTSEQVRKAIYFENVAQAVYRSSIRVPGSTSPKTIVVMDKASALWLQSELPGSTVVGMAWVPEDIGIRAKPGRKGKYSNGADRTFHCRENKKNRLKKSQLFDSMEQIDFDLIAAEAAIIAKAMRPDKCNEIDIISNKDIVTKFYGMQFPDRFARTCSSVILHESNDKFVEFLRYKHGDPWREKESQDLISPSFFLQDRDKETDRGANNVEFARGIYLDNDGGDLSYLDFARIFPKIRMVFWNTASSTSESLRWRVYIPTSGTISREAYEFTVHEMLRIVAASGFHSVKSGIYPSDGFDTSKIGPASLFYLPCQAVNSSDSFFVDFNGEGRSDLDVREWIDRFYCEDEQHHEIDDRSSSMPDERVGELIRLACIHWRSNVVKGTGNAEFFALALKLATLGLSRQDVEGVLCEECQHASSAKSVTERRRQIPAILRTLKSWHLF